MRRIFQKGDEVAQGGQRDAERFGASRKRSKFVEKPSNYNSLVIFYSAPFQNLNLSAHSILKTSVAEPGFFLAGSGA